MEPWCNCYALYTHIPLLSKILILVNMFEFWESVREPILNLWVGLLRSECGSALPGLPSLVYSLTARARCRPLPSRFLMKVNWKIVDYNILLCQVAENWLKIHVDAYFVVDNTITVLTDFFRGYQRNLCTRLPKTTEHEIKVEKKWDSWTWSDPIFSMSNISEQISFS